MSDPYLPASALSRVLVQHLAHEQHASTTRLSMHALLLADTSAAIHEIGGFVEEFLRMVPEGQRSPFVNMQKVAAMRQKRGDAASVVASVMNQQDDAPGIAGGARGPRSRTKPSRRKPDRKPRRQRVRVPQPRSDDLDDMLAAEGIATQFGDKELLREEREELQHPNEPGLERAVNADMANDVRRARAVQPLPNVSAQDSTCMLMQGVSRDMEIFISMPWCHREVSSIVQLWRSSADGWARAYRAYRQCTDNHPTAQYRCALEAAVVVSQAANFTRDVMFTTQQLLPAALTGGAASSHRRELEEVVTKETVEALRSSICHLLKKHRKSIDDVTPEEMVAAMCGMLHEYTADELARACGTSGCGVMSSQMKLWRSRQIWFHSDKSRALLVEAFRRVFGAEAHMATGSREKYYRCTDTTRAMSEEEGIAVAAMTWDAVASIQPQVEKRSEELQSMVRRAADNAVSRKEEGDAGAEGPARGLSFALEALRARFSPDVETMMNSTTERMMLNGLQALHAAAVERTDAISFQSAASSVWSETHNLFVTSFGLRAMPRFLGVILMSILEPLADTGRTTLYQMAMDMEGNFSYGNEMLPFFKLQWITAAAAGVEAILAAAKAPGGQKLSAAKGALGRGAVRTAVPVAVSLFAPSVVVSALTFAAWGISASRILGVTSAVAKHRKKTGWGIPLKMDPVRVANINDWDGLLPTDPSHSWFANSEQLTWRRLSLQGHGVSVCLPFGGKGGPLSSCTDDDRPVHPLLAWRALQALEAHEARLRTCGRLAGDLLGSGVPAHLWESADTFPQAVAAGILLVQKGGTPAHAFLQVFLRVLQCVGEKAYASPSQWVSTIACRGDGDLAELMDLSAALGQHATRAATLTQVLAQGHNEQDIWRTMAVQHRTSKGEQALGSIVRSMPFLDVQRVLNARPLQADASQTSTSSRLPTVLDELFRPAFTRSVKFLLEHEEAQLRKAGVPTSVPSASDVEASNPQSILDAFKRSVCAAARSLLTALVDMSTQKHNRALALLGVCEEAVSARWSIGLFADVATLVCNALASIAPLQLIITETSGATIMKKPLNAMHYLVQRLFTDDGAATVTSVEELPAVSLHTLMNASRDILTTHLEFVQPFLSAGGHGSVSMRVPEGAMSKLVHNKLDMITAIPRLHQDCVNIGAWLHVWDLLMQRYKDTVSSAAAAQMHVYMMWATNQPGAATPDDIDRIFMQASTHVRTRFASRRPIQQQMLRHLRDGRTKEEAVLALRVHFARQIVSTTEMPFSVVPPEKSVLRRAADRATGWVARGLQKVSQLAARHGHYAKAPARAAKNVAVWAASKSIRALLHAPWLVKGTFATVMAGFFLYTNALAVMSGAVLSVVSTGIPPAMFAVDDMIRGRNGFIGLAKGSAVSLGLVAAAGSSYTAMQGVGGFRMGHTAMLDIGNETLWRSIGGAAVLYGLFRAYTEAKADMRTRHKNRHHRETLGMSTRQYTTMTRELRFRPIFTKARATTMQEVTAQFNALVEHQRDMWDVPRGAENISRSKEVWYMFQNTVSLVTDKPGSPADMFNGVSLSAISPAKSEDIFGALPTLCADALTLDTPEHARCVALGCSAGPTSAPPMGAGAGAGAGARPQ